MLCCAVISCVQHSGVLHAFSVHGCGRVDGRRQGRLSGLPHWRLLPWRRARVAHGWILELIAVPGAHRVCDSGVMPRRARQQRGQQSAHLERWGDCRAVHQHRRQLRAGIHWRAMRAVCRRVLHAQLAVHIVRHTAPRLVHLCLRAERPALMSPSLRVTMCVLSFSCGSSTDQTSAIVTALVAGAVVMLLIALGVAALSPTHLAMAVTSFLVLQQLALAGVDGAQNSPYYREQLSTAFTWLNLVRPHCTVTEQRVELREALAHFRLSACSLSVSSSISTCRSFALVAAASRSDSEPGGTSTARVPSATWLNCACVCALLSARVRRASRSSTSSSCPVLCSCWLACSSSSHASSACSAGRAAADGRQMRSRG